MKTFDLAKKFNMPLNGNEIEKISLCLVVTVVGIIPLIVFPKTIASSTDIYNFYKEWFLIIISIVMLMMIVLKVIKRDRLYINYPLTLFLFGVFLSTIFSNDVTFSMFGHSSWTQGFITYLSYWIIFTFIVNFLEFKYIKYLLMILFISGTIVSLYAVIQFYGYEPLSVIPQFKFLADTFVQTRSTFGNRNFTGSYFTIVTLTSVFWYLNSTKGFFSKILLVTSCLFFSGLIVSLTRGCWIAATLTFVYILWLMRKKYKLIYKKVIVLVFSFLLIILLLNFTTNNQVFSRYTEFNNELNNSNPNSVKMLGSGRMDIYLKVLPLIPQHPILGVGPDSLFFHGVYAEKAHCEYLEYVATMGIPTVCFYLAFLFLLFIRIKKVFNDLPAHICGIYAGFIAYCFQATLNIGITGVLVVFFSYCAILESYNLKQLLGKSL